MPVMSAGEREVAEKPPPTTSRDRAAIREFIVFCKYDNSSYLWSRLMRTLVTALLWFSAIGCGLLAGLYSAFSTFVMTALGRIDQAAGISAMNAINAVIVQSLFMPVFLASTLTSLALAVLALFRWDEPGAVMWLAGGVLYVVGM